MSSRALVFLLVTLLNLACSTTHQDGNLTDSFALLALKSNLHDPKGVLNSWNHSVHFCQWEGVTCGRLHKRVTTLILESSGLSGSLSPHIGNLSFLKMLDLQENNFEGDIPNEIGRLFRLRVLLLSNNSFGGEIPGNLSHCSSLSILDLQNNKLVGEIPIQLFSLNITVLAIMTNNITGNIPGSIRNLTSLEYFGAGLNLFKGTIPSALGELPSLKVLQLEGNKISGMIPLSIYNLSLLNALALSDNELVGTLPKDLGLSFPHIQEFRIRQNSFHGSIPLSIVNASKLTNIDFAKNNFSGKVPSFGRLKNLVELNIYQNQLGTKGSEDDVSILIDSLTNCTLLQVFSIAKNNISGTIPNSVGNLSIQVSHLYFYDNRIYGVIPLGLGNLVNLEILQMDTNQFEGVIPHDITNLQRLYMLSLSENKLRGRIPSSLGNMSFLSELHLNKNKLEGVIPSSLGSCKNLLLLDMYQNNLTDIIPKELFDASSLSIYLDLSHNHLVGPIPPEVGKLKNLAEFYVTENKLFGEIPPELSSCSSMVALYLEGNQFTGSISLALKSLTSLQELDLSQNNLSGTIPNFLEKFSLNHLNLSFNDFEGELPMQGAFANASVISIEGNSRLCGGISDLRLPRCKITKSKRRRLSLLHVILISSGSSILATLILSLLIIWWRKNKRREQSSQSPLKESFSNVSYGDLVKATNGFSSTNIIGMGSFGSVYKGILDQDEMMVAVKVINLERYGASKSFEAECKVLRNIRHRNLLKIITSCSSIDSKGNDFKALVYEYMPNGSLERWLHSDQETLNLRQRIDIAFDVAYALDYLHHQSGNPVTHCDLKPSNVLLDDDMVAHVGDFGLAKFAILQSPDENHESRSVGLKGTIGYAAPEYGLGNEASTSGDIYSYGILLLEMMTGKSPIDPMFGEGLNLHHYARTSLPDNVIEIVEPNLLHNDEEAVAQVAADNRRTNRGEDSINENIVEDCIVSVLKIGVACSMESPQDRIDINDIIHQLQSIKRTLGRH